MTVFYVFPVLWVQGLGCVGVNTGWAGRQCGLTCYPTAMEMDSPTALRAVFEVFDPAGVIPFRFVTLPHRLLFDTRHNETEGPLLRLVPRAASPEERLKTIKQMRPHFRLPEKISSVWWPKHIHSLADFGAWDRILRRIGASGYPQIADRAADVFREMEFKERVEVYNAIIGARYHAPLVRARQPLRRRLDDPPRSLGVDGLEARGAFFDDDPHDMDDGFHLGHPPRQDFDGGGGDVARGGVDAGKVAGAAPGERGIPRPDRGGGAGPREPARDRPGDKTRAPQDCGTLRAQRGQQPTGIGRVQLELQ